MIYRHKMINCSWQYYEISNAYLVKKCEKINENIVCIFYIGICCEQKS